MAKCPAGHLTTSEQIQLLESAGGGGILGAVLNIQVYIGANSSSRRVLAEYFRERGDKK